MDLSELDYELPPELIAQHPAERRDASRLLVYDRATRRGRATARSRELPEELRGELVVVNDTRVVPARIPIESPRGEVLLLERIDGDLWEALARPTRRLAPGGATARSSCSSISARAAGACGSTASRAARRRCRPTSPRRSTTPSATRPSTRASPGSAAAPTAGLHFTPELLARLDVERVTLHVGLDTFRPVTEDGSRSTRSTASATRSRPAAWERIRAAERVLAVGTTTVRDARDARPRRPLAGARSSSSRRASSSAASTRSSRTSTFRARRCSPS